MLGGPPAWAGQCADYRPGYKNVYFGDTHTHTAFSLDSYFFNSLSDPRTAHRFAKGLEPAPYPPRGSEDVFTLGQQAMIDRPLDFNAITDHAELLGAFKQGCDVSPQMQQRCDESIGQPIRDDIVEIVRGETPFQSQFLQSLGADWPGTPAAWDVTKQINDEEYEPCVYTTLHGYEYTPNELGQMLHRNVIFRGDRMQVPADVIPSVQPTTATFPENGNDDWYLFDRLALDCTDAIGCQALTIPHNANASDGRMFLAAGEDAGMTVVGELAGVPLGRKLDYSGTEPGGDAGPGMAAGPGVYRPMTTADAELRRRYDRNFEMTQHKGQSECAVGAEGHFLATDESLDADCDFEIAKSACAGDGADPAVCALFCTGDVTTDPMFCGLRVPADNTVDVCVTGGPDGSSRSAEDPDRPSNCLSPLDFYRNAVAEGLLIKQTLGVNPYRMNISAALDTHNGVSGNAQERGFLGHGGVLDDDPREQLGFWYCEDDPGADPNDPARCPGRLFHDFARSLNPGGLAGVWAGENTREEVWDALHSGETFGTSGTRMRIRSVAAWNPLPGDVCEQLAAGRDLIDGEVVSQGAQMGGDLPPHPEGAGAPHFAVIALQDPDGVPLQKIDMVKGFINQNGEPKVHVYREIAASPAEVRPPDPQSCAVQLFGRPRLPVQGSDTSTEEAGGTPVPHPGSLCAVWSDPEFDATKDAFWYARALEIPSCRWSDYLCGPDAVNAAGDPVTVDCGLLDARNGAFPAHTGLHGFEGCCAIREENGLFSGRKRFNPIKERAWASPIWYEVN